ncbi:U3 snoRNP protein [Zalaria obscura]|uniref:U3 snoRNP protein n=1 Tax=Zalaria obscura TaxID=2024903 RepID=A0ACC3SDP9_9PEZI
MNTTPGDLYEQGLMTLFTESIKGIQGTLHSGGNAVLLCLISRCFDRSASESERHHATKIMTGALISIMHHTDAETFEPILKAVFDFTGFSDGKAAQDEIDIANHLLFTVAATRKGTRISDWPTFVARLMNLFRLVNERSQEFEASSTIALLNTLAVVFQTAPMPTILPHAFKYLTDMTGGLDKEDKGSKDLFEKLCTHAKHVKGLVPFWEALLAVLKSKDSGLTFTGPHIDSLLETAISYLSTPSHELRRVSLEIISTIYSNRGEEIPDLLTVAISIEDTPPNVQTMRFISAQIRRFALGYSNVQSDSIMAKLIPTYCMGILHFRLAQAWDDAVQTLKIQKSALTAILSWKTPGVKRYEERLTNILDEARFREEISVFLRLDQEEAIRLEDLPELMSVLLRLLYGRAVTRAGSASGKRGQQTRRKAIFVALSKFPESVLAHFIDIALGQFATAKPIRDGELAQDILKAFTVPQRKQFGLLNMVEDMLNTLGDELQPFAHSLANCVLICLLKSSRVISTPTDSDEETVEDANPTSLDRAIRQSAYHCLIQLFSTCTEVAWGPYARVIMHELIGPRLEKFPIETAQSISGILRVFSTWSSSLPMSRFLVEFYPETLQKIAETITVPSAKFQVKLFIVQNIFSKLLDLSADDDTVTSTILAPNAGYLVTQLGDLLRQNPPKELLDASVLCVSRLAPLVKDPKDVAKRKQAAALHGPENPGRYQGVPARGGILV